METNAIVSAVKAMCGAGHSYVEKSVLRAECSGETDFDTQLRVQEEEGLLHEENGLIYLETTWRYEQSAARDLAVLLSRSPRNLPVLPDPFSVGGTLLVPEQIFAIRTALSHSITLILGPGGSGKSTLVAGILAAVPNPKEVSLVAPTGKAARNLSDKTGHPASTIHHALGVFPGSDFLAVGTRRDIDTIIVDEASMMTLAMLAGVLCALPENGRLILIGDDAQLRSVGTGNIISDLIDAGVPCCRLACNHRQDNSASELWHNTRYYSDIWQYSDLLSGGSFQIRDPAAQRDLVERAAQLYRMGISGQVITPINNRAAKLNKAIRDVVNPIRSVNESGSYGGQVFREGDRVIITKNDRRRKCQNGDIGVLRFGDNGDIAVHIDGRPPVRWSQDELAAGAAAIDLAYALTVHKAQGSQYDYVLVDMPMCRLLDRNWFYTAISRAQKGVVIYGSEEAIDKAVRTAPPLRRSRLAQRIRSCLNLAA